MDRPQNTAICYHCHELIVRSNFARKDRNYWVHPRTGTILCAVPMRRVSAKPMLGIALVFDEQKITRLASFPVESLCPDCGKELRSLRRNPQGEYVYLCDCNAMLGFSWNPEGAVAIMQETPA